jgi:hypothetical protein
MPIVVVQEHGAPAPLVESRVVSDTRLVAQRPRDEREWDILCGKLVELVTTGRATLPVNLFLILDREEFDERDRPAFGRILTQAREKTWGARIFLVLTSARSAATFPADARPELTAWMDDLIAGRVTDIIQIGNVDPYDPYDREALYPRLRDCATSAVTRQKTLREVSGRRPWRCAVPAEWDELAKVFGVRAITEPDDDFRSDLLIVLSPPEVPGHSEAEIDRYLATDPARRRSYHVITHMHWADRHLKEHCKVRGLGEPLSTAEDFELWHVLLRLNALASTEELLQHDSVHAVSLAEAPTLKPSHRSSKVLVTSVFGPDEEEHWLEAAKDIGNFLLASSTALDFRVELCVDQQRLNTILREMKVLDVWIHMGHGSGKAGLWVPQGGNIGVHRWARCFQDMELQLAIFLTCASDDIARHFAEQGTGVAIGFEGEDVVPCNARELGIGVLRAMMADSTSRSILNGFRTGAAWYESVADLQDARPRAYHPRVV